MTKFKDRSGRPITDEQVASWARQAEDGFPGARFTNPPVGRPPLGGRGPSPARSVRLPPSMDRAVVALAQAEGATPSAVIREAVAEYLFSRA
ncbi:MAG: ribbon-helix-helix domain-containing protein [Bifidobacteriaceae bacterium]|jgi:hypothetical protein|nr:ribbon-helix-helix domain-containing protein [Bifidobacteriaceae bacterium]